MLICLWWRHKVLQLRVFASPIRPSRAARAEGFLLEGAHATFPLVEVQRVRASRVRPSLRLSRAARAEGFL